MKTVYVSDKIDGNQKTVTINKGGHYIMLEVSTHQEDITFVSIYVSNIEAPKYIKKILKDLKGKTGIQ